MSFNDNDNPFEAVRKAQQERMEELAAAALRAEENRQLRAADVIERLDLLLGDLWSRINSGNFTPAQEKDMLHDVLSAERERAWLLDAYPVGRREQFTG